MTRCVSIRLSRLYLNKLFNWTTTFIREGKGATNSQFYFFVSLEIC